MRTAAPSRSVLRAATEDLHDRVDRHPLLTPLATGHGTEAEIARALACLAGFIGVHEDRVAGIDAALVPHPRLAARYRADLARLAPDATPWPCPTTEPPTEGAAGWALGTAWVLMGSRKGAALMARRNAGRPGVLGSLASLMPHPADAVVWSVIETRLAHPAPEVAIDAARDAFSRLLSILAAAGAGASAG